MIANIVGKEKEQVDEKDYLEMIDREKGSINSEYRTHEEEVVNKIKENIEDLQMFVESWREHFVKGMTPKHLPPHWSITRSIQQT